MMERPLVTRRLTASPRALRRPLKASPSPSSGARAMGRFARL
jgi:hypothetical protein